MSIIVLTGALSQITSLYNIPGYCNVYLGDHLSVQYLILKLFNCLTFQSLLNIMYSYAIVTTVRVQLTSPGKHAGDGFYREEVMLPESACASSGVLLLGVSCPLLRSTATYQQVIPLPRLLVNRGV